MKNSQRRPKRSHQRRMRTRRETWKFQEEEAQFHMERTMQEAKSALGEGQNMHSEKVWGDLVKDWFFRLGCADRKMEQQGPGIPGSQSCHLQAVKWHYTH